MQGFITDTSLQLAEEEFPGIGQVYAQLADKPRTFLQLVWLYLGLGRITSRACGSALRPATPTSRVATGGSRHSNANPGASTSAR